MQILLIVRGNYPTPEASSKRITNYIKALQLEQHSVEVLPVFIKTKTNLQDLVYSHFVPFLAFWMTVKKASHSSVVFIYGFGWVGKLLILSACKLKRKPVAMEVNEKPYSIHGSRRDYVLKYFEPFHEFCLTRVVYPMVDGFIVITDALYRDINMFKRKNAIICKVPILVDYEFYQKRVDRPECLSPFILHSATLNDNKDGIINVFRAFTKIVSERGIKLHFYLTSRLGLPKIKKLINEIVSENGLEHYVHFLGDLDEETLLAYQQHCDMVVINKVDCKQNRYNFATKIGEYLALGKPVITTRIGEVSSYLKHNISCLFVDPSSSEDIAAAIIRLIEDPAFGEKIGEEGKIIAKRGFDYRSQSKIINQFFNDLG